MSNLAFVIVLAFRLSVAAQTPEPAPPTANPGRPTVSTPATLTPVGYLQFENGLLVATNFGQFSRRVGLNQVTKLTAHRRAELIVQFEPLVRSHFHEHSDVNAGGVSAGVQVVLVEGQAARPTIAASYFRSVYGGSAPDLDIGSATNTGILLLSDDLLGLHVDANAIVNQQVDGNRHRAQYGQTLSISRQIGRISVTGELWHFSQPLSGGNCAGSLWALAYSVSNTLVVDGGFNRGLTSTSTPWELFAGFTYLLPHRLWPEHHP